MSASLVGSEMCIRDRPRNQVPGNQAGRAKLSAVVPVESNAAQVASCWAVSYTHLTLPTICSV
eukprot:13054216-Alexandrium_andersonii.AAC.1